MGFHRFREGRSGVSLFYLICQHSVFQTLSLYVYIVDEGVATRAPVGYAAILYGFPCEMDFSHHESPNPARVCKVADYENHVRWIYLWRQAVLSPNIHCNAAECSASMEITIDSTCNYLTHNMRQKCLYIGVHI